MKLISALSLLCISASSLADETPTMNLNTNSITVSGLSSGGYMATQFHIANSDWVKGAAILAGGPYYCGQNDITTALSQCVDKIDGTIPLNKLMEQTETWANKGEIAPLTHLQDAKVWLFHGTADTRVNAKVSDALYEQYKQWVAPTNLTYINNKTVAHVFPTVNEGKSCITSESPYIGNCNYDAAGELLTYLLGELSQPDDTLSGSVISYNQHDIAGDNAKTLAEKGYAYVPKSCQSQEACDVHVSFHGCNQFAEAVGMEYVNNTGLNRWADDNQIVVFYPQTRKSLFMPLNPQGCWDWWGYTGANYATRSGAQLQAVESIIKHFSK